jgi:hypothetical protein
VKVTMYSEARRRYGPQNKVVFIMPASKDYKDAGVQIFEQTLIKGYSKLTCMDFCLLLLSLTAIL